MRTVLALALLLLAPEARAAFEQSGASARSLGMGRAFSAIADDASAMLMNPAGPSQLGRPELVAMYGKLHLGLTDNSDLSDGIASLAVPVQRWGTVAVAWHQLQLANAYAENTFALGWSRKLRDDLHGGVNLKLLRRGFTGDAYTAIDPVFSKGTSSSDAGLDVGLLWRPGKFSGALSLLNVNRPDVGLAASDRVPLEARVGVGYRVPNTAIGLDLSRVDGKMNAAFGGELWIGGRFGTRGGFEIGAGDRKALNAGLSARFSTFQVDYAFNLPVGTIAGTQGSHRFSLAARFGRSEPQERSHYEGEMTPEAAAQMEAMRQTLDASRKSLEAAENRSQRLETAVDVLQEQIRKTPPPAVESSTMPSRENLQNQLLEMQERSRRQAAETEELRQQLKRLEEGQTRRAPVVPAPVPVVTPEPATPPAPAKPTSYKVQEGDTLQSIAEKLYGDPARWDELYKRNSDKVKRGGRVVPGTVLDLP